MPLLAVGLALLLPVTGCAPSEWVPVRYGAPLTADHATNLATNRCARDCWDAADDDSASFYECLSACPGIVRLGSSTCEDPAERPEAFCYTQWFERPAEERASAGGEIAIFFGRIFAAFLEGLIQSAFSHDERDQARRESTGAERHERRRHDAERRERSRSEPRRYVPGRPRRR